MAAKNRQSQRGSSLAEVILATAVIAVVAGIASNEIAKNRRSVDARNVGEYMAAFQAGALSYAVDTNAAILAAAADGTGAATTCVGNYVSPGPGETLNSPFNAPGGKATCAVDVSWLVFKGYLPSSFKVTNAHGQAPVAIYKRVYSGPTATPNLEMLVVGASKVGANAYDIHGKPDKRFGQSQYNFAAAALLGTNMGVVPDNESLPGCGSQQACGVQGAWKSNVADFSNSPAE